MFLTAMLLTLSGVLAGCSEVTNASSQRDYAQRFPQIGGRSGGGGS